MRQTQFQAIARAIADARHASAPSGGLGELSAHSRIFDSLAREVADTLATQSGRFNRARFLNACGVSGETLAKGLTRFP